MSIITYPYVSTGEELFGARLIKGNTYQFDVEYKKVVDTSILSTVGFAKQAFSNQYDDFNGGIPPAFTPPAPAIFNFQNQWQEIVTSYSGLCVSNNTENGQDDLFSSLDKSLAFASINITELDKAEYDGNYFLKIQRAVITQSEVISETTVNSGPGVQDKGVVTSQGWFWDDEFFGLEHWEYRWEFATHTTHIIITTTKVVRYDLYIRHAPVDGTEAPDGTYYLSAWRTVNTVLSQPVDTPPLIDTTENDSYEEVPIDTYNLNTTTYPPERPEDHADDEWDPDGDDDGSGGWTDDPTDLATLGGGRYGQNLVVLGHKKIYFGAI